MSRIHNNTRVVINARFLTQELTGVQRFASEISRRLGKSGLDIACISPKKILDTPTAEELHAVSYGNLKGHAWEQIGLRIYLKKHNTPLLVNLANTAPLLYSNQIVTIHDLSFLRNPSWFSRPFYSYYKFLIPRIVKTALKIVTVSLFSKKELMELLHIPEHRIAVIYNAVSDELRCRPTIPENSNPQDYILTVSSLNPRKNLTNLIEAYNRLECKNIKLVIVGSKKNIFAKNTKNPIKRNMLPNQNVIFKEALSNKELAHLYANATLFIFPSFYEGFGLPPLEAMSCGCPTIVSNTASMPEVCGEAAYYIDPHNIDSIANGMYRVITDQNLRKSLISKGNERVKCFSWEKSARGYMDVLKDVMQS
jgi:glycosyltransferase involved in cell wall biosynthesis